LPSARQSLASPLAPSTVICVVFIWFSFAFVFAPTM
jgi:hypothetical protein